MHRFMLCFLLATLGGVQTPVLAEDMEIVAFIDDGYDVYINGEKLDLVPGKVTSATIDEGDVVAVKVWDMQGGTGGGFAMAITRKDGKATLTDTKWRYSRTLQEKWNTKAFDDKIWRRAKKVERKWMDGGIREHFKGERKPAIIWGEGGTVYLRKTISSADFK